ncbi:uncharacterized protein V1516DRAFT_687818 [Lipomyces oligophaga]|uniref:uncharacterized protein n=1 Tax=Lipomyces oligophaga TaxID=45792 RepID=UPI0034CE61D0
MFDALAPFYRDESVVEAPGKLTTFKIPQLDDTQFAKYITYYMINVHCYYPILDSEIINILFSITGDTNVELGVALLLNMVVTFGASAATQDISEENTTQHSECSEIEAKYWKNTAMLLALNTNNSIYSIQAAALAAIDGCTDIYQAEQKSVPGILLYNLIDLISPSGITKYEEIVPYPSSSVISMPSHMYHHLIVADKMVADDSAVLLQLITNSSMRKSINRINATIYSLQLTHHAQADYLAWMLQYAHEFNQHHKALLEHVPRYIYDSPPNTKWNISRLHRRRSAFNCIVNRNFVDYVVHNPESIPAD